MTTDTSDLEVASSPLSAALDRAEKAESELRRYRSDSAYANGHADGMRAEAEDVWVDMEDDLTDAVKDSHPVNSGNWENYERAQKLVGNRRSKAALVGLVNHLLRQASPSGED